MERQQDKTKATALCWKGKNLIWSRATRFRGFAGHTRSAELVTFLFDESGVCVHVNFAGEHEVEFDGVVAEKFAVDAGPEQAAIGADVDFGDPQMDGGLEVGWREAAGGGVDLAAGGVDAAGFFRWGGGGVGRGHGGTPAQ